MSNTTKPIYAPAVIDFITVAAEYCVYLEQVASTTRRQFLERITRLLPLIYVKATLLPYMEEVGDDDLAEIVQEEDYNFVRQKVWSILRADDNYLEVFMPDMQYSEGPLTTSISEDLADIYQDLKNFVAVFADNNEVSMNNAIVRVQDNFANYWGQRLVNAMRPLHDLLYRAHDHDEDDDASLHDDAACGHHHTTDGDFSF